jgi:hypothetical protein
MELWVVSFFDSLVGRQDWTLIAADSVKEAKKYFLDGLDSEGLIIMKVARHG